MLEYLENHSFWAVGKKRRLVGKKRRFKNEVFGTVQHPLDTNPTFQRPPCDFSTGSLPSQTFSLNKSLKCWGMFNPLDPLTYLTVSLRSATAQVVQGSAAITRCNFCEETWATVSRCHPLVFRGGSRNITVKHHFLKKTSNR